MSENELWHYNIPYLEEDIEELEFQKFLLREMMENRASQYRFMIK